MSGQDKPREYQFVVYAIDAAIDVIREHQPGLVPLIYNLNRTKDAFDALKSELASLRAENKEVKESLANWKRNADARWDGLVKYENKIADLKAEIEEAKEELTNRSEALANVTADWLEARNEIGKMKGEVERLKSQLAQAELAELDAGEYYVVYHKNHPEPAEAFVAKFKEYENLVSRYRAALEFYANLTGWDNGKRTNTAAYEVARQALAAESPVNNKVDNDVYNRDEK